MGNAYEDADDEPLERDGLPFLKDPKTKVGMWALIKDAGGKDITKMTVPVYFNEPTSVIQKMA